MSDDYYVSAKELVSRMTLEEKALLLTGDGWWATHRIDRLGIPSISVTDGPHGVRKGQGAGLVKSVPATCFPTASALASSWNPDLIRRVGVALGQESQAIDVQILLGPGVNMKRSPLGGRNFEYFSEDPLLAGKLAAAYIEGVQSQGVGTSLKHYAVNNQEFERMATSSDLDERTLNEIYLPAFEIAVKEGQPWSVMSAYNLVNGVYASEHKELLQDILRDKLGIHWVRCVRTGEGLMTVSRVSAPAQISRCPAAANTTARKSSKRSQVALFRPAKIWTNRSRKCSPSF